MPHKTFICADIGTSSLKIALIDRDGGGDLVVRAFRRESYVRGMSAAGLEAAFYQGCAALANARRLGGGGEGAPASVDAVCISAAGPNMVPVTENGEALPILWWFLPAERCPELSSFFLPYVLWQKRNRPEDFNRCARYFSLQEYIAWKLGGAAVTVLPNAAYIPYFWDERQLKRARIDGGRFPAFVPPAVKIGTISKEASRRCHIPENVPIVSACTDFIMALLGAGVCVPGMACDRAGSSEGINLCITEQESRRPIPAGLRLLPHAVEGLWNLSAVIPESGSLFERYRVKNGLDVYRYDDLLAALIPDNGSGTAAQTARIKIDKAVIDEGRAVLDKLAGNVRAALALFAGHGCPIPEMVISGGQAKSARWNRYKAERIGCKLIVPQIPDAELAGNAAAAAKALLPDV
jgi:sugar (pentulose or hexulose) kinase